MSSTSKSPNNDFGPKPICPSCGYNGSFNGVFCPQCGKKLAKEQTNAPFMPPPPPPPPDKPKSKLSRAILIGIAIGVVAAVLVTAIIFGALVLSPGNNNSATPTPTPSAVPTLQPNPTLTPTQQPTPSPSPAAQDVIITGINIQFQYTQSDQGYFGPTSQTVSLDNQPNGYLSVKSGQRFFVYFTLNAPTSGTASDSVTTVTVATPGFTLVSVEPQTPIAFTTASSKQITVTLDSPQTVYNGPIDLVLTTSG